MKIPVRDIFLSEYSREELHELNRRIIAEARLRQRQRAQQIVHANNYLPGARVEFTTKQGRTVRAIVERINGKTVGVTAIDQHGSRLVGQGWRVPPSMLRPSA